MKRGYVDIRDSKFREKGQTDFSNRFHSGRPVAAVNGYKAKHTDSLSKIDRIATIVKL